MHLLSYRGFVATVERDPKLGVLTGTLRDVPDPVRFRAETVAALPRRMAETVDEYIARRHEWGLPCGRPFTADRRVWIGGVPRSA